MPQFTTSFDNDVALRAKAVLDHRGRTGTPAEQLEMVKKESVEFLIRWLRAGEAEMQQELAQIGLTDPEIT